MANPNIVNVSNIYGKVAGQSIGTSASEIVSNPAQSGKIFKINAISIANVDGSNSASVTVELYKDQSTIFHLAKTIVVPENSTLVVLSKDTSIYLEENDSIRIYGSHAQRLQGVCSYEEIS